MPSETTSAAGFLAATTGCALFDLTDRSQIELTGSDRAAFLHNFCTQDIKRLAVGQGAEAFITNIKGRILGHVFVFAGESSLWIDSSPGSAAGLVGHLDRYLITEDVQLADRSGDWGEFAVVGPTAGGLVDRLVAGSGAFAPLQHGHGTRGAGFQPAGPIQFSGQAGSLPQGDLKPADGEFNGFSVTVRRAPIAGDSCWLVGTNSDRQSELRQQLIDWGAEPADRNTFEGLRLEAGFPTYGVDLTDDHLAPEAARTAEAISFAKGCYLGQEPIARIDALGHTNRELRGVTFADRITIPPGTPVLNDEGRPVGTISSSAIIPVGSRTVALAMLRREVGTPGTVVRVEVAGGIQEGVVRGRE